MLHCLTYLWLRLISLKWLSLAIIASEKREGDGDVTPYLYVETDSQSFITGLINEYSLVSFLGNFSIGTVSQYFRQLAVLISESVHISLRCKK